MSEDLYSVDEENLESIKSLIVTVFCESPF